MPPGSPWLERVVQIAAPAAIAALGVLLVTAAAPPERNSGSAPDSGLAAPQLPPCADETDGLLTGQLYGAIEVKLQAPDPKLRCAATLRPEGGGMRLFFAPGGEELLLVIGVAATPSTALSQELAANVTIVDERRGQFFSSGESERCWTRFHRVEPGAGDHGTWQIGGTLFCSGALPALNGDGSVTPGELEFLARLVTEDN